GTHDYVKQKHGIRSHFLLGEGPFRPPGRRLLGTPSMNEQELLNDRLLQLKSEHRDLDDAIHALSQRGVPDMIQIQRLKKRKLQLRDEIMKIESQLLPDIIA